MMDDRIGVLQETFETFSRISDDLKGAYDQLCDRVGRLARLREEAARLDRLAALGEMAAGIAHEVRNPLNAVEGFAGLLARQLAEIEGGEVAFGYTRKILEAAREANAIIQSLLEFARPEQLSFDRVRVGEVLDEVLSEEARDGLRVAREGEHEIRGDRRRLKQVFRNLIRNAVQAMEGRAGRLAVGVSREGQSVIIRVDDSGPGVPETVRDRIFDPFFTTREEGTGLGLSIVHKVIALHGGTVEVEEGRLGGAGFVIRLPAPEGSG